MRDRYIPAFTARLKSGWAIVDADGNLSDFAKAEGVSKAAISKWLATHNLDALHAALKSGRNSWGLPPEAEERRAVLVADALKANQPMRRVAEAEGVSDAAISYWLKRNWTLVEDHLSGEAA